MNKAALFFIAYIVALISIVILGIYNIHSDYSNSVLYFVIAFILFSFIVPLFYFHTKRFPRNQLSEYKLQVSSHQNETKQIIKEYMNVFTNSSGIWKSSNGILLDLRGFIFPKTYIKAFLIRQIKYLEINKKAYPIIYLFRSGIKLETTNPLWDFAITLYSSGREYHIDVSRKGKILDSFLTNNINRATFWIDFVIPPVKNYLWRVVRMDEEKYRKGNL